MKLICFLCLTLALIAQTACLDIDTPGDKFDGVAPGKWRFAFNLKTENVPFILEVKNTDNDKEPIFELVNGDQRITSSRVNLFRRNARDTALVYFDEAGTMLELSHEGDVMQGYWMDQEGNGFARQLFGRFGYYERFKDLREKPKADISGKWAIKLYNDKGEERSGNLEIEVSGVNQAKAYLLLDGRRIGPFVGLAQGDRLQASFFDAKEMGLLDATIESGEKLIKGGCILGKGKAYAWEAAQL